eukprot:364588-Chlamydomonas_euryale.AAC.18
MDCGRAVSATTARPSRQKRVGAGVACLCHGTSLGTGKGASAPWTKSRQHFGADAHGATTVTEASRALKAPRRTRSGRVPGMASAGRRVNLQGRVRHVRKSDGRGAHLQRRPTPQRVDRAAHTV